MFVNSTNGHTRDTNLVSFTDTTTSTFTLHPSLTRISAWIHSSGLYFWDMSKRTSGKSLDMKGDIFAILTGQSVGKHLSVPANAFSHVRIRPAMITPSPRSLQPHPAE